MAETIFLLYNKQTIHRNLLIDLLVRSGFKVNSSVTVEMAKEFEIKYMVSHVVDEGDLSKIIIFEHDERSNRWLNIVWYWNRRVEKEKQGGEVRLPDKIVLPSVMADVTQK